MMIEEEYLEHIRTENEKHREALRQDHLAYIENVKQALIDIQTQQSFDALRANFASAALNGIIAQDTHKNITVCMQVNCEIAWQYADKMIETMGELK